LHQSNQRENQKKKGGDERKLLSSARHEYTAKEKSEKRAGRHVDASQYTGQDRIVTGLREREAALHCNALKAFSLDSPAPEGAFLLPQFHCTDGRRRRRRPGRNVSGAQRRQAREGPRPGGGRLRRQPPLPQALPHRGPSVRPLSVMSCEVPRLGSLRVGSFVDPNRVGD